MITEHIFLAVLLRKYSMFHYSRKSTRFAFSRHDWRTKSQYLTKLHVLLKCIKFAYPLHFFYIQINIFYILSNSFLLSSLANHFILCLQSRLQIRHFNFIGWQPKSQISLWNDMQAFEYRLPTDYISIFCVTWWCL